MISDSSRFLKKRAQYVHWRNSLFAAYIFTVYWPNQGGSIEPHFHWNCAVMDRDIYLNDAFGLCHITRVSVIKKQ